MSHFGWENRPVWHARISDLIPKKERSSMKMSMFQLEQITLKTKTD